MTPSWLHSIVTVEGVDYRLRFRKGDLFVADALDGSGVRAVRVEWLPGWVLTGGRP